MAVKPRKQKNTPSQKPAPNKPKAVPEPVKQAAPSKVAASSPVAPPPPLAALKSGSNLPASTVEPVPVSVEFDDDSSLTYEGSRIPWWVRLMWVGFWIIAIYYMVVLALPDAEMHLLGK